MNENLQLFASLPINKRPRTDDPEVFKQQVNLLTYEALNTAEISDFEGFLAGLNKAGIIVAKDAIYLKAKYTHVRNSNNKDIAVFNDDGSINANLINAKQIVADGLKANTFDAGNATINNLIVTNAQVTGEITATSGSIGGFEIGTDQIGLTSSSSSFYQRESEMALTRNALYLWGKRRVSGSVYDYKSCITLVPTYGTGHIQVVDDDVLSGSETARALIYLRSTSPSKAGITSFSNKGLWINIKGASEDGGTTDSGNHALWIENGDIAGLRLKAFIADKSYTISKYDGFILNTAKNDNTVYTLPSPADSVGQVIFIANKYNYTCVVKGSIYNQGYASAVTVGRYGMAIFISDGYHWIFKWFKW